MNDKNLITLQFPIIEEIFNRLTQLVSYELPKNIKNPANTPAVEQAFKVITQQLTQLFERELANKKNLPNTDASLKSPFFESIFEVIDQLISSRFPHPNQKTSLPQKVISQRVLSVLESISCYLKEKYNNLDAHQQRSDKLLKEFFDFIENGFPPEHSVGLLIEIDKLLTDVLLPVYSNTKSSLENNYFPLSKTIVICYLAHYFIKNHVLNLRIKYLAPIGMGNFLSLYQNDIYKKQLELPVYFTVETICRKILDSESACARVRDLPKFVISLQIYKRVLTSEDLKSQKPAEINDSIITRLDLILFNFSRRFSINLLSASTQPTNVSDILQIDQQTLSRNNYKFDKPAQNDNSLIFSAPLFQKETEIYLDLNQKYNALAAEVASKEKIQTLRTFLDSIKEIINFFEKHLFPDFLLLAQYYSLYTDLVLDEIITEWMIFYKKPLEEQLNENANIYRNLKEKLTNCELNFYKHSLVYLDKDREWRERCGIKDYQIATEEAIKINQLQRLDKFYLWMQEIFVTQISLMTTLPQDDRVLNHLSNLTTVKNELSDLLKLAQEDFLKTSAHNTPFNVNFIQDVSQMTPENAYQQAMQIKKSQSQLQEQLDSAEPIEKLQLYMADLQGSLTCLQLASVTSFRYPYQSYFDLNQIYSDFFQKYFGLHSQGLTTKASDYELFSIVSGYVWNKSSQLIFSPLQRDVILKEMGDLVKILERCEQVCHDPGIKACSKLLYYSISCNQHYPLITTNYDELADTFNHILKSLSEPSSPLQHAIVTTCTTFIFAYECRELQLDKFPRKFKSHFFPYNLDQLIDRFYELKLPTLLEKLSFTFENEENLVAPQMIPIFLITISDALSISANHENLAKPYFQKHVFVQEDLNGPQWNIYLKLLELIRQRLTFQEHVFPNSTYDNQLQLITKEIEGLYQYKNLSEQAWQKNQELMYDEESKFLKNSFNKNPQENVDTYVDIIKELSQFNYNMALQKFCSLKENSVLSSKRILEKGEELLSYLDTVVDDVKEESSLCKYFYLMADTELYSVQRIEDQLAKVVNKKAILPEFNFYPKMIETLRNAQTHIATCHALFKSSNQDSFNEESLTLEKIVRKEKAINDHLLELSDYLPKLQKQLQEDLRHFRETHPQAWKPTGRTSFHTKHRQDVEKAVKMLNLDNANNEEERLLESIAPNTTRQDSLPRSSLKITFLEKSRPKTTVSQTTTHLKSEPLPIQLKK